MDAPVLVVGATGILEPLASRLAARGEPVVGVARTVPPHGPVAMLAADTTTAAGTRRVAAAGPFRASVLYAPAITPQTRDPLLAAVHGPAVLVLTSSAADPQHVADPAAIAPARRPRDGDRVLVLGWRADGGWHTPAQVSDAALALLDSDGEDAVLGRVRPWSARP